MFTAYVFCLVLGGGLLLLSLASGDSTELDVDMDVEVDLDMGVDAGADLDADVAPDAGAVSAAQKIFSFRGLIYGLFGFGLTGTILSTLELSPLPTAGASVVAGVLSSVLVTSVFNYLRATESGYLPGDATFAGASGRVVLPISAEAPGAVVVVRGGREVRLRALPHASGAGDPTGWTRVMVIEMDDGVARVAPVEDGQLLDS